MDRATHLFWIWVILTGVAYLFTSSLLNSVVIGGGITFLGEHIFYGD